MFLFLIVPNLSHPEFFDETREFFLSESKYEMKKNFTMARVNLPERKSYKS